MTCPHCGLPFSQAPTECSSCGFSAEGLDARLGAHTVEINRIVDTAHALRLRDTNRIEALVDEFERRFPQVFCTIFVGLLPSGISAAEGGFWLLNHGVRTCQEEVRENRFGIALIIDPSTHAASISLGYTIAAMLPEERIRELLHRVSLPLWHGDYSRAIVAVVKGLDKLLRKHGRSRLRPSFLDRIKPLMLVGFKTRPIETPVEEVKS